MGGERMSVGAKCARPREASVSMTQFIFGRMCLRWWPRTRAGFYRSAMVEKARTHHSNTERKLANMADGVILTRALASIAEVKVWKLETLSAGGEDIDELERAEASAQLTKALCTYGKQVERMLEFGSSLEDIAHLTSMEVDELRLAVSYAR